MRKFLRNKPVPFFAAIAIALLMTVFLFTSNTGRAEKTPPPAAESAPAMQVAELGWTVRCPEAAPGAKEKPRCEGFQRLEVKDSKSRIAEFAVGFPQGPDVARGAVVLPLGILLEQGVVMKIDDNKPVTFKVQYCTSGGCVSFVNLGKEMLDQLRKGDNVHFLFKTAEGQNVDLGMKLDGFGKVLKQVL